MLLVVGLLGTFLGLGMAPIIINILSQSNAVASNMGDPDWHPLGLGTEFVNLGHHGLYCCSRFGVRSLALMKSVWLGWLLRSKLELHREKAERLAEGKT